MPSRRLLLCVAMLLAGCAEPSDDRLVGEVVRVVDGDTIAVRAGNTEHEIQLACIDAPETLQLYGRAAAKALSDHVLGKTVSVELTATDPLGRRLGNVRTDGRHVNLWMVENGWAWHFRDYGTLEQFAAAEAAAKKAKLALWSDPAPVPPWQWRRERNQPPNAP